MFQKGAVAMTWGIFKGLYKGRGIYWSGSYNVEGNGDYATMSAVQGAIDRHLEEEEQKRQNKPVPTNCLIARRDDSHVTLTTPDGELKLTHQEYRRRVFDLEAKYDMNVEFV